ncbi:T9SS C-terminal target domain-containing protein [Sphingobacteriales bacterium UPWRP_1]|nr:hypothetical protein BVG80_06505 [Sphingobacteriales bacterium TSM_CSM]PSJ78060.1 T9SS C-terminal target domain-containing protein [Sphingobacteriales bacterium UPWRP_1]
MKIYANWRQIGRTIFEITPEEETQLLAIANSHTATAYKAQSLLFVSRGYEFTVNLPELDFVNWSNWQTAFKNAAASGNPNRVVSTFYPNPAQNKLQITLAAPLPRPLSEVETSITLYTLTGQLVLQTQLAPGEASKTVSVGHLPAGIYVCRWQQAAGGASGYIKVAVVR